MNKFILPFVIYGKVRSDEDNSLIDPIKIIKDHLITGDEDKIK